MMHPLDESDMPYPPDILVDRLRSLLAEVPGDWKIIADERARLLVIDGKDLPQGYVDLTHGLLVMLDGDIDRLW